MAAAITPTSSGTPAEQLEGLVPAITSDERNVWRGPSYVISRLDY